MDDYFLTVFHTRDIEKMAKLINFAQNPTREKRFKTFPFGDHFLCGV